jgi:hypothetical protein
MGPVEKSRNELIAQKYDLWFDVYRNLKPQSFLKLNSSINQNIKNFCNKEIDINQLVWKDWPTCVRRAFIEEVLFSVGSAQKMAEYYQLNVEEVRSKVEIFLLPKDLFETKVREAGWGGPIFFRGATMPNPKDETRRWIILNDDFLKQYTSFEYPILQMLELAGIANHELSHVMQDFLGYKKGLNIEVRSAEQALLIEGQAEYIAEESFKKLGIFYQLFATEQADEVINREGDQASQFPYTIGLPFMATLYKSMGTDSSKEFELTVNILKILGNNTSVSDFLLQNF